MSLLTSYTRPTPTSLRGLVRQTDVRIEPVDGRAVISGAVVAADTAYFVSFRVAVPFPATAMEYLCVAAAGNVDLGIFSTADFTNFTMLSHTGATLAAGTSAVQSINLLATLNLVPGVDYFASIVGNNAALTIARIAGFNNINFASRSSYLKASLNPLASFSTPQVSGLVPWMAIK